MVCFAPFAAHAKKYKHKSEAEIKALTPAQRVDEWVNEQVHHRFNVSDRHRDLLRKHIMPDGLKALPRLIQIMDEYDPTKFREGKGRRGERFDACWLMLGYIDDFAIRLRGSEEGRSAINALERAIERMRQAGYGQPDQQEWEQHGRFNLALLTLDEAGGINEKDKDIRGTFRFNYKISLSDTELLRFSNFLTSNYPEYPSWSEIDLIKDSSQLNGVGVPVQIGVLRKPERFYKAYLEFEETKH